LSKLLTAKRPSLLPVRDAHVLNALFESTKIGKGGGTTFDHALDDWEPWRIRMTNIEGTSLSLAANIALVDAGYTHPVSVLRTVDIVVWMRHHGWRYSKGNLPQAFTNEPSFVGRLTP